MSIPSIFVIVMTVSSFAAHAQKDSLPIREWPADEQKPFVLYITGDGGFNSFSTNLCKAVATQGYSVAAMNAKAYFWDKKTPDQTAADVSAYLQKKFDRRSNQQLILLGYSFGADVMPFVVNRLAEPLEAKLLSVVLISPSTSTDFEIHWSDMFGGNAKRSLDVVAEINKMTAAKTATFFGADESDFPVGEIKIANYRNQTLPGGHRYDGHTVQLAREVIKEFR